MPERAVNTKSATGFLLILLPAALAMSALFIAWPIILGVTVLIASGNIWQNYEWSKTVRSIDPVFQQSIVQYRGEITPLDLSVKANIPGSVAKRYLAAKAHEFGTSSRLHPDRGQVYYFVSISTLGSILDDSEVELPELMPATTPVVAFQSQPATSVVETVVQSAATPAATVTIAMPTASAPTPELATPSVAIPDLPADLPQEIASVAPTETASDDLPQELAPSTPIVSEHVEPEPVAISLEPTPSATAPLVTILQSDLAKRLDVHSSTVYKRRSEPNFTDWTRNRDPDGIGWGYSVASKEYYRVDT
ncbi:hypothetical protein [Chamaesiphon minutus]|uniref:Uncharacterized protein n=1 Tax=Chamaesiphon minutus (strain ATCC 27169 / PCC 6605) TaxID=1173020 RepID=K9UG56_CHAP6|nr:hypothetical protein [Chamaesiphon minutus]AFY94102.1 hypothetical protein Cha6605_3079 [Chamaesiphon minutus PCC 6605]